MDYLLGIDLGTTNLKALLIDREGKVVAQASAAYPTQTPQPGWSEQDPKVWWKRLCELLPSVIGKVRPTDISAVGLSGQMHGAVFVDGQGELLRPCIIWVDQRAIQEAEEIEDRIGWDVLRTTVGNRSLPDFTLPKILWIQKNEPELFRRTEKILLPKGYIRFRLTGKFYMEVADGSSALLVDIYKRTWAEEILTELQVPLSKLPPLCESTAIVGKITPTAAKQTGLAEGTPVIAGAGDQQAGALGSGVIKPGVVSATIGTGGQVYTTAESPVVEPEGRVHTFCQCLPDKWHIMGAMKTAGLALSWFHRNVLADQITYEKIDEWAEQAEPGSNGLIFLPYLTGERTPHLNPDAKGVFFGLTLEHNLAYLARALMEGVAFGMRDSLELLKEMDLPIEEIRLAGGGAKSRRWSQIQADIYGMRVYKAPVKDQSAYGAALLAGLGVGFYPELDRLPQRLFEAEKRIDPIERNVQAYNQLHKRYKSLYRALEDLFTM
ncbi:MAG: xylulokinase [Candidatus Bipolaricaulia bacterium]